MSQVRTSREFRELLSVVLRVWAPAGVKGRTAVGWELEAVGVWGGGVVGCGGEGG